MLLSTYWNSAAGNTGLVHPSTALRELFRGRSHRHCLYKQPLPSPSVVSFLSHKDTRYPGFFIIGNNKSPAFGDLGKRLPKAQFILEMAVQHYQVSVRLTRGNPLVTSLSMDTGITSDAVAMQCCPLCTHNHSPLRRPNVVGLLPGTLPPDALRCGSERTSKVPCLQTLPTTWTWSWIFVRRDRPMVQILSLARSRWLQRCHINQ